MFSNVNEVIQQVYLAERDGYRFAIDWSSSPYRDPDRAEDPWLYYFEPVWRDILVPPPDASALPGGAPVACCKDNIITPRMVDGECNPLLLPEDRFVPGKIIDRHIRLNERTRTAVDIFQKDRLDAPYLGLHIRGPGRVDGGVPKLRAAHGSPDVVPLSAYFDIVDSRLREMPADAKVFASSDSSEVIDAVKRRYADRVVTYAATRSAFGEMHANHPANQGLAFDPYKLGLDVVVEAALLAASDFLVHGNSNVANFVLCRSPKLPHRYVLA